MNDLPAPPRRRPKPLHVALVCGALFFSLYAAGEAGEPHACAAFRVAHNSTQDALGLDIVPYPSPCR